MSQPEIAEGDKDCTKLRACARESDITCQREGEAAATATPLTAAITGHRNR